MIPHKFLFLELKTFQHKATFIFYERLMTLNIQM